MTGKKPIKKDNYNDLLKKLQELGVTADSESTEGISIPLGEYQVEVREGQLFIQKKEDPAADEAPEEYPSPEEDKKKKKEVPPAECADSGIPDGLQKWMEKNKKKPAEPPAEEKSKMGKVEAEFLTVLVQKFEDQNKKMSDMEKLIVALKKAETASPKSKEEAEEAADDTEEESDNEDFTEEDYVPGSGALALLKGIKDGTAYF